ncbi:Hypothetical protein BROD_1483 [Brucella sp. NF 2653]|nr:Hypothetical protein BIBO1_2869 [Brucella inopinata BO1]EFM62543.1 Hypothetical protein BROD_1483 [Brucella sp. NF 2653]
MRFPQTALSAVIGTMPTPFAISWRAGTGFAEMFRAHLPRRPERKIT